MYLQCAAHFVVAEYITGSSWREVVEQNVKTLICSAGTHTYQFDEIWLISWTETEP